MKDINNKYILEITEKGKVIKTHYFNHWQERMIFALIIKQSNQKVMSEQTKQLENEVGKKNKDDEKIELMTQFMLDPTSSATKLLEKRREN